ncbi:uncharacterized protein OCT59_014501 [Rhizophagus irregularis]|uniref:uncharacterized protein n=1 Tax=Rhizophagus irregularis TaxID=588596 RepID=UPI0033248EDD|nr:hypothetical protein OCT59_014501 [Rhizophagus irregularis]
MKHLTVQKTLKFDVTRWLSSLHKSRRSKLSLRISGKESIDNRRVHANNRLNDVLEQTAQQLRSRNYDNEIQCYDKVSPDDAPDWSYIDQPDMLYDTEYTDDLNIDDEDLDAILEDKADKSESFMQED